MQRVTKQRKAIEKVFADHNLPMGVEEVLCKGRVYVENLNQATVYRNLNRLVEEGYLGKKTHPEAGTLFERRSRGHQHYFHCSNCNRLFELPCCTINEDKLTPAGFKTEGHELHLFGLCNECSD